MLHEAICGKVSPIRIGLMRPSTSPESSLNDDTLLEHTVNENEQSTTAGGARTAINAEMIRLIEKQLLDVLNFGDEVGNSFVSFSNVTLQSSILSNRLCF